MNDIDSSLIPLTKYYYKNSNFIFCRFYSYDAYELIRLEIDVNNFEVLNSYLLMDNVFIYYFNNKISVDKNSFKIINNNFALDKNHVYFFTLLKNKHEERAIFKIVSEADPTTFRILSNGYAIDCKSLYFYSIDNIEESNYCLLKVCDIITDNFDLIKFESTVILKTKSNFFLNGYLIKHYNGGKLYLLSKFIIDNKPHLFYTDDYSIYYLVEGNFEFESRLLFISNQDFARSGLIDYLRELVEEPILLSFKAI